MKRRLLIFIVALFLPALTVSAQAYEGVWTETRTVTFTGGQKTVTVVWADLNDEQIRIDTVLAEGKIGQVDTLGGIVNSATDGDGVAIAGINGSFFEAYSDLQPLGHLIVEGETLHLNGSGSVLTVDANNSFSVETVDVTITGGTKDQWEWPYNWYGWEINHYDFANDNAVMVFNRFYDGPMPEHDFTAIQVNNGVVTDITVGGFDIPVEGFLVLTKEQTIIDKFIVGELADYKMVYEDTDSDIDFETIRTSIGAGPTLVKGGIIVLDAASEGFTEEKILNQAAQRSLVGVTADGYLGMVSVSGATMAQLAEIAINLGMVEAINLDGGASSGVYYNNSYITEPGREISNALVVRRLYEDPITVTLNGETLFFDAEPYINDVYDRTLVPLRKITEALGATVGWDGETSSVIIERNDIKIKLKEGSTTVYVNEKAVEMEVPLTIRESRSYVPVRFITEYFGGDVDWNGETNTVILAIDNVAEIMAEAETYYTENNYYSAINKYKEVLEIDADNVTAIKKIAYIYNVALGDKASAVPYYELAYSLDATDESSLNSLAWALSTMDIAESAKWFNVYTTNFPEHSMGYYGLAICYISYGYEDPEKAYRYFQLAIEKGLTGSDLTYAENYINNY
jgi:tetratricopeptide (TPR) repeat protein